MQQVKLRHSPALVAILRAIGRLIEGTDFLNTSHGQTHRENLMQQVTLRHNPADVACLQLKATTQVVFIIILNTPLRSNSP
jgi:hypothetical protein